MIKVLGDWDEIGRCYRNLLERDLPPHVRVEKNWDLETLRTLVAESPRGLPILDMGCGGLHTLSFLHALGFEHLRGVDLHLSLRERTRGLRAAVRDRTVRLPFRLRRADLVRTPFRDSSFDMITCISTVEHGVDVRAFLSEARRLLPAGGRLLVTTDYWEPEMHVRDDLRPFGVDWRVFSALEVTSLIESARDVGFRLLDPDATIPPCTDACVLAYGYEYTFIALGFVAT